MEGPLAGDKREHRFVRFYFIKSCLDLREATCFVVVVFVTVFILSRNLYCDMRDDKILCFII